SFHESAHAWMAHRLGDDTAKEQGRVSLNPIVHIDPVGTVLFPLLQQIFAGAVLLGWAQPTPSHPANSPPDVTLRKGHILVAAAGPVSNFILMLAFTALLALIVRGGLAEVQNPVVGVALFGVELNLVLGLFNFVPVPPLDGSKVASFALPRALGEAYDRVMKPYGFVFLLLVLVYAGRLLAPVQNTILLFLYSLIR